MGDKIIAKLCSLGIFADAAAFQCRLLPWGAWKIKIHKLINNSTTIYNYIFNTYSILAAAGALAELATGFPSFLALAFVGIIAQSVYAIVLQTK
jgi:hypothetical protein